MYIDDCIVFADAYNEFVPRLDSVLWTFQKTQFIPKRKQMFFWFQRT